MYHKFQTSLTVTTINMLMLVSSCKSVRQWRLYDMEHMHRTSLNRQARRCVGILLPLSILDVLLNLVYISWCGV